MSSWTRRRCPRQRRGSLYLMVASVAMIVSMIGMTALHVSRVGLHTAVSQREQSYARLIAQSSVEFAVSRLAIRPDWRTHYTHNQLNEAQALGLDFKLRFKFIDPRDGDLSNDDTQPIEIHGIGQYGDATFTYCIDFAPAVTFADQVGPLQVAGYDAGSTTQEDVDDTAYLGQHFVPNLPAAAESWSVTRIDVYLQAHGAPNGTLNVCLYRSDGNGRPATLIETVSFTEPELPGSFGWHSIAFTSAVGLAPGTGLSLTLEGSGDGNAATAPYQTSLSLPDTHLLRGGWGSWNTSNSQSLLYRVHGVYTTSAGSGDFQISPGSWQRVDTP